MNIEFINLTPHNINIANKEGAIIKTIVASGMVARAETAREYIRTVDGIDIYLTVFGAVSGIPAQKEGVIYITSTIVAKAANRVDVVAPDTGITAVRQKGNVLAVRDLQI